MTEDTCRAPSPPSPPARFTSSSRSPTPGGQIRAAPGASPHPDPPRGIDSRDGGTGNRSAARARTGGRHTVVGPPRKLVPHAPAAASRRPASARQPNDPASREPRTAPAGRHVQVEAPAPVALRRGPRVLVGLDRPPVEAELRRLLARMARDNPTWGAPRITSELAKLGLRISERIVSRYLPRRRPPAEDRQLTRTWRMGFWRGAGTNLSEVDLPACLLDPRRCTTEPT